MSAMGIFQLFFTSKWCCEVVSFMNTHALKVLNQSLKTSQNEVLAFIAVHIYMGIHYLPRISMYWNDESRHAFVTALFSRDRFQLMNSCFCLAPPEKRCAVDDPYLHTKRFIAHLNDTMPFLFFPHQEMAFDEAMCAYTGRSDIKQYLPMKPHPYGYKIWCLASEKYVLQIELYQCADDSFSQDGKMCDLIKRMVKRYTGRGHILYCDTFFTSPKLVTRLRDMKIYVCGSVSLNRQGMLPAEQVTADTLKKMKRWESLHYEHDNMSLAVWKDAKVVKVLYNHISPLAPDVYVTRWNDSGRKVRVRCPRALYDYFQHARAVDVFDQLHYSYIIGRKSMNQRTRLVWWLVDLCVVNAFTLYSRTRDSTDQLNFRKMLYKELASAHKQSIHTPEVSSVHERGPLLATVHYSVRVDTEKACVVCSGKGGKRVRTKHICAKCEKHLCIGECFRCYHVNIGR